MFKCHIVYISVHTCLNVIKSADDGENLLIFHYNFTPPPHTLSQTHTHTQWKGVICEDVYSAFGYICILIRGVGGGGSDMLVRF